MQKLERQIQTLLNCLKIKDYVKLVILFGSQARGDNRQKSDIDIAVLLDERMIVPNPLELRSELNGFFSSHLGNECDVVLINQAPPLLKFQIVKYGRLLYKKAEFSYSSFFSQVLKEYFDFRHYQNFHNNLLLNRLKERR